LHALYSHDCSNVARSFVRTNFNAKNATKCVISRKLYPRQGKLKQGSTVYTYSSTLENPGYSPVADPVSASARARSGERDPARARSGERAGLLRPQRVPGALFKGRVPGGVPIKLKAFCPFSYKGRGTGLANIFVQLLIFVLFRS